MSSYVYNPFTDNLDNKGTSGGGGGTVTSFSFTDANGFDGTVTDPTGAADLTLSTSVADFNVIYADSGALTGTGTGTAGQVLTSNGPSAAPTWQNPVTLTGTGTTINTSTADLITLTLANTPAAYRFTFNIAGRETTTGDTVGYSVLGTVKTNGTTAYIVALPYTDNDEDDSLIEAQANLIASGNDAILRVTGVNLTTITYAAVGIYTVV
jgi:hypothetical protein